MAVTQGVHSTILIEGPYVVARGTVDMGAWSSEREAEMSVSEFSAEKLQSVGEVEVSKLEDLGGDSVAELLGDGVYRAQIATGRNCGWVKKKSSDE